MQKTCEAEQLLGIPIPGLKHECAFGTCPRGLPPGPRQLQKQRTERLASKGTWQAKQAAQEAGRQEAHRQFPRQSPTQEDLQAISDCLSWVNPLPLPGACSSTPCPSQNGVSQHHHIIWLTLRITTHIVITCKHPWHPLHVRNQTLINDCLISFANRQLL